MSALLKFPYHSKQDPTSSPIFLEGAELEPLLSGYLSTGFKQDTPVISSLTIDGPVSVAKCRMSEFFSSPNFPGFHLSFTMGQAFLCQAMIAHALYINGIRKKEVEVILTDFSIKLVKPVRDPEEIVLASNILSRVVTQPGSARKTHRTYYTWQFSVNDGSWMGHLTMVFPIEPKEVFFK